MSVINKIDETFPKELIIELKGLSPELVGRIVVFRNGKLFDVEVDIVQSESGKIYNHIAIIYKQDDSRDAISAGLSHMQSYLNKKTELKFSKPLK